MKILTILFLTIFVLNACSPGIKSSDISSCNSTLDALSELTSGLDIPVNFQVEDPVKAGGEFDLMQYFTVLDHLSLLPGVVLDYVYHFDGMGGKPILYARQLTQAPYPSELELVAAGSGLDYLDYVQADGTPEGYFQFVVLSRMAGQFYLYWHSNYNDSQIVCNQQAVKSIVSNLNGDFGYPISPSARIQAYLLGNISPSVTVGDENIEVQFMTFTRWGGFFQETYTLLKTQPHTILDIQEVNLIPYDCGVMF